MSRPVHELFAAHPQVAGEAFSELIYRLGDFKVLSTGGDPAIPDFPPKPAYLTGLLAAYREDDNQPVGSPLRRQIHFAAAKNITAPQVAGAIVDTYDTIVRPCQEIVDTYGGSTRMVAESLAQAVEQKAVESRLRNVGMFAVFSSTEGEHFAGLLIPRNAYVDLPLEARELVLGVMRDLEGLGIDISEFLGDRTKRQF